MNEVVEGTIVESLSSGQQYRVYSSLWARTYTYEAKKLYVYLEKIPDDGSNRLEVTIDEFHKCFVAVVSKKDQT